MTRKNKTGQEEIQPLFQRLQAKLAELIAATPAGSRLPTEPEMAKQLGVSRATLREAMRTFEWQGLIRRRQGKGTFVISQPPVLDSGLEELQSIENMAKKIGLDVSLGRMEVTQISANDELAEVFNCAVETPLLQVERVIQAENRPVAYLIDVVPEMVLSLDDLRHEFTGSVLDLFLRRGAPKLQTSVAEIRAAPAASEIAKLLEIQRGDVLLMFQSKLYTSDHQMIDYSSSYFLPGYFRFHVVRRVGQLS
ncbi:MAG TPA: GntR family transcriptional regulator [Anaerolineaceae bacterium]|nr:GntR family transcriptional regulator [Anaerolineaceae bacterium]